MTNLMNAVEANCHNVGAPERTRGARTVTRRNPTSIKCDGHIVRAAFALRQRLWRNDRCTQMETCDYKNKIIIESKLFILEWHQTLSLM